MPIKRVAGTIEFHVVGQFHRQIGFRHRHDSARRTMENRDRAAPVALARYAPVTQAVIDLSLSNGLIAARFALLALCDHLLRVRYRQPVEKARIDHPAAAIIGDVGDDEGLRVLSFGAHDRRVAEAIFVGKIKVALVMGRSAVNGAGAVFHQNEVGHIDRQLPGRVEWMDRLDAGIKAKLLGLVDQLLGRAGALAFGDEGCECRILGGG